MKATPFFSLLLATTLVVGSGNSIAAPESDVKGKWRTPYGLYLTPQEAYDMKTANPDSVALIDVRTRAEAKFVGMATVVDAHIPVRFLRDDYAWSDKGHTFRTQSNDQFVDAVSSFLSSKQLDKDSTIILMCQSGSRVPIAARKLHKVGFTKVYTQYQGFEGLKAKTGEKKGQRVVNGWKNADLPWSYKLGKEKMYFNFSTD